MAIVEIANKTNGRPIKFTPERIEQIKNLVERGKSREDIAEIINVTVGSLQVTCSRLGISLRRPKPRLRLAPFVPRSPSVEPALPAMPAVADKPCFGLVIQYKGKERVTDLPLTDDAVRKLTLEATFHSISVAELIRSINHDDPGGARRIRRNGWGMGAAGLATHIVGTLTIPCALLLRYPAADCSQGRRRGPAAG